MNFRSRVIALVAVLALGALAVAAHAQNAVTKKSTVTIHRGASIDQPIFFGRVKGSPKCIAKRKIKVYEVAPEQGLYDFTTTNENGKWKLDTQITDSTEAKAVATSKTSGGTICSQATSKVVSF
jgi:hypothetical protein